MADVLIARRTAVVRLDGSPVRVRRGATLAHAEHPIVRENPDLWKPLPVDYDIDTAASATASTGDVPSAKDVRAWAVDQGIDVPARGKVPDDVVEAYQAAHSGG